MAGGRQGLIRRATENDIPRITEIRNNVRENKLTDPTRVTIEHVRWFISNPGIFVWEEAGQVVGFSAADPRNGSIWALFMDQAYEGRGIARALFEQACAVLRDAGFVRMWLKRAPKRFIEPPDGMSSGTEGANCYSKPPSPCSSRSGCPSASCRAKACPERRPGARHPRLAVPVLPMTGMPGPRPSLGAGLRPA